VSRAATKRFQHLAEARLALDWEPAQLVILALVSNALTRVDLDTRALAASPAPSPADAARLRIAIRADETVAMRGLTKLGLLMDQSNLRTSFARAHRARHHRTAGRSGSRRAGQAAPDRLSGDWESVRPGRTERQAPHKRFRVHSIARNR